MSQQSTPPGGHRVPSYRHHKPSDRAVVTLNGRDIWLGKWDSPESKTKYKRAVAEWLSAGRQLAVNPSEVTVVELIARFYTHAETYYRHADGTPTGEAGNFRSVLTLLNDLYGDTLAKDFNTSTLRAVRHAMVEKGWARTNINGQTHRLRLVFRWAVENDVIPSVVRQDDGTFRGIVESLAALKGLKRGRTNAKESAPVKPVPDAHVYAIKPHVTDEVWAIIRFQWLTGARPGEVVIARTGDIDTTGKVWIYRPAKHKGQHHEHGREIRVGPQAQDVIRPFLKPDLAAYLFSPSDAMSRRRKALSEKRAESGTPLSCGNVPGSHVARKPKRPPGDRYDVASYRRAIERGCELAFPLPDHLARVKVAGTGRKATPRWETDTEWRARLGEAAWKSMKAWRVDHKWHPHQLRHNTATMLRREFGIDIAQTILGHRLGSSITELYAEVNVERAEQVLMKIG